MVKHKQIPRMLDDTLWGDIKVANELSRKPRDNTWDKLGHILQINLDVRLIAKLSKILGKSYV